MTKLNTLSNALLALLVYLAGSLSAYVVDKVLTNDGYVLVNGVVVFTVAIYILVLAVITILVGAYHTYLVQKLLRELHKGE